VKASWSQGLKVFGRAATVSAEYDRAAKSDFLKEVTLSGSSGPVDYELSTKFDGDTACKLSTKTSDGTTIEAEGTTNVWFGTGKVNKLTANRATTVQGQECDIELSHDLSSSESKLSLSSVLGSGVKAIGRLTSQGKESKLSYEIEYDTALDEGRTLSAKVSPAEGTGEIEYVDSSTLDATITANIPLGGAPKVTVSRAFEF